MKKIIVSMMIAGAFMMSANAQEVRPMKHNSQHYGKHHKGMMMKELNLTADQKAQLKTSHESYKQQLGELNKNEAITVKESRDRKDALRRGQKEKIMAILTPDQKIKLEQIKNNRQARHQAMAAKRLDKMKTKLNLSDEQVAKISAANQAEHEQFKAITQNENLSRTEKKDQMMALREQNKNNFKSILTPEQISKMEEIKKARMETKQAK